MDHLIVRLLCVARLGYPGGVLHTAARLALLLAFGLLDRRRLQAWLALVETHRRLVACGPAPLRLAPGGEFVLWQAVQGGRTLRLVLGCRAGLGDDGELALHLVEAATRIASVAFTLGCRADVKLVYAGALRCDAAACYGLAVALHRMPAQEFLRASFRALCGQLGAARILAADGGDFDLGPFELDIALDEAARERQDLLARVAAEIGRACGYAYTPTVPLVHLQSALS